MITESESRNILVLVSNFPPYSSITWNSTGHLTRATGTNPAFIDLIANRFHWTYSWVPLGRDLLIGNAPNEKGLIGHLLDGDADTIVGAIVPLTERFQLTDFTMPVFYGLDSLMIPYPKKSINDYALGQPFQPSVWIALTVCVIAIVTFWYLSLFFQRYFNDDKRKRNFGFEPVDYAISVLLSQGSYCNDKGSNSVRLIAGFWCLAAAVLIPAYSGQLISFVTSPIEKAVIQSVYDIPNVPGLKVAVDRGKGIDGLFRQMAASMKDTSLGRVAATTQGSMFRCNTSNECYHKVLSGHHVYINSIFVLNKLMLDDFNEVGQCRFTLARKALIEGYQIWAVPKRSKALLDSLNKGVLELNAFGLSNYWKAHFFQEPKICLNRVHQPSVKKSLSLSDNSGTFLVLVIGCAASGAVFLFEFLIFRANFKNFENCYS